MPRMSGTELAITIRRNRPDLPVILATGYLGLPKEALELGLPKLDKPFGQDQLQALIREILRAGGNGLAAI